MAVGDVTFWKEEISGFSPTTTNRITSGWTQITGTADLGQSATHLVIIDNGLVRVILNKNDADQDSAKIYAFNGSSWVFLYNNVGGLGTFTVASVTRNLPQQVTLEITFLNAAGNTVGATLSVSQSLPALHWRLNSFSGSPTGEFDFAFAYTIVRKTYLTSKSGTGIIAADVYGEQNDRVDDFTADAPFSMAPLPTFGVDAIIAASTDEPFFHDVDGSTGDREGYAQLTSADLPAHIWIGFMPRTYGMGDGGGANVGNGDGQLREAEDNYTVQSGTFSVDSGVAGSSNSKVLLCTAPVVNDEVRWSMNFPAAGKYYIGIMTKANAAGGFLDMSIDAAFTGVPKAFSTDDYTTALNHTLFGPFTIATAGNHTVAIKLTTVGSVTTYGYDFLAIYPYEATAASPATAIFPKDLARALLRQVTPA